MKRKIASSQTFCAMAESPVKMAKVKIVAARTLVRPKRSAIGPQMNDKPQPTRNRANRIDPASPTLDVVAAYPERGSNSVSAGVSTSA
jgi:hypothetical protein